MAERPEAEIFRRNIPAIARAIAENHVEIQWLADQLAAIDFIDDTSICVTHGITPYEKASSLLKAVQTKVTASYEDTRGNFVKFAEILRGKKQWKMLGKHLLEQYGMSRECDKHYQCVRGLYMVYISMQGERWLGPIDRILISY